MVGRRRGRVEKEKKREEKRRGEENTESLDDVEDLVDVRLARPQWAACQHFSKDAAQGPHIDGRAILRVAHEQLGCAVPACGDVVCVDGARAR